ncbi:maleate cis-trans isomerase family protein [Ruegeria arenilitoris]|uniref:maleate cis-trans isomerase family protein n=1 Tax=Ruegeria arenilitoris TaxID=1173585 RepID=UPI00147F947E|nr:Asp/Glu racemase [Ruegeria arenilitoris]
MKSSRGRARFGVLVPFTNSNLEPDMAMMCPEGVSLHFGRMGGYDEDKIPDEKQMHGLGAADLDEPLRLLMGVKPDVVIYGCTSATLTHGLQFDSALAERIRSSSGAKTVTAAGALVNALKTLGTRRIGFASPYVKAINDMAVKFLDEAGIRTVARSEVDETLDNEGQGALGTSRVLELGLRADHPEADAVVMSCTDMRSVEVLSQLEQELGKPVICSNQAMVFQAMQMLEIFEPVQGFGQLLDQVGTCNQHN